MQAGKLAASPRPSRNMASAKAGHRKRRAWQHGCNAPKADGDRERLARAQLVGQATRDQHRDAISQLKRDGDDPVLVVIQARNHAFERVFQIGDHGAVDVGDDRGEKQHARKSSSAGRSCGPPARRWQKKLATRHLLETFGQTPGKAFVVRPIIPARGGVAWLRLYRQNSSAVAVRIRVSYAAEVNRGRAGRRR